MRLYYHGTASEYATLSHVRFKTVYNLASTMASTYTVFLALLSHRVMAGILKEKGHCLIIMSQVQLTIFLTLSSQFLIFSAVSLHTSMKSNLV